MNQLKNGTTYDIEHVKKGKFKAMILNHCDQFAVGCVMAGEALPNHLPNGSATVGDGVLLQTGKFTVSKCK